MRNVYFISGLGADERVFKLLQLEFCHPVFIKWIPALPDETLEHYASRLREKIPEKDPVVVGLSLGGMLAAAMAVREPGLQAILLSSIKDRNEFPRYLNVFKYVPVYRILPGVFFKKMQWMYTYIFGVKDKKHKQIIFDVIRDADIKFVKWAMHAILHWKYVKPTDNMVQIHGTGDRLLRIKFVKPDYTIQRGSHTMTMDKYREVSALLKQLIIPHPPAS